MLKWKAPAQRARFAEEGYFEVVGCDTGKHYRIYAGAVTNVRELDEKGRPKIGLCFVPVGGLPIGNVMLFQKIALEKYESGALAVARSSVPNLSFLKRPADHCERKSHNRLANEGCFRKNLS
jgi:hypothetical protein